MTHTTTQQIYEAAIASNTAPRWAADLVNGHRVEAQIREVGRRSVMRKGSGEMVIWYVDGKRVAKANLEAAVK